MPEYFLHFVRHGETEANRQGVRSGGDVDVPLTALGRQQASDAAAAMIQAGVSVGAIVTSSLSRTRETAALFSAALHVPVTESALLAERHLGAWNGRSIAETEADLRAGVTPPGGESNADFTARITQALIAILPLLPQNPLLVGSKGTGRVLLTVLTGKPWEVLGNCQRITLRFADPSRLMAERVE